MSQGPTAADSGASERADKERCSLASGRWPESQLGVTIMSQASGGVAVATLMGLDWIGGAVPWKLHIVVSELWGHNWPN